MPPLRLVRGEHRDIEEEIANRILSDISEENSVASADDVELATRSTKEVCMHSFIYSTEDKSNAEIGNHLISAHFFR